MRRTLNRSKEPKPVSEEKQHGLAPQGRAVASESSAVVSGYREEIHKRAETVTPLLQGLLDFRPPPHWGINE